MNDPRVEIIDAHGNVLEEKPLSEAKKHKLLHRIAGIVVTNSKGELLVYRKSMTSDNGGKYALLLCMPLQVGETFVPAAARIVREQLRLNKVNIKAIFSFKYSGDEANLSVGVFHLQYAGAIDPNPVEIGDHFFASLEETEKLIKEKEFLPTSVEVFRRFRKGVR